MWNRIKVAAEIGVNDLSMAGVEQLVDLLHGIQRAAVWPIGILLRLQIGLENWLENQPSSRLCHSIGDRGHPQRPLLPVRLWYIYPPHGLRLIGSAFQRLRQFVEPSLQPILPDVLERLVVYSCCSTVGLAAFIGERQHIRPIHFVVQGVKAKTRRFLRFLVQRRLQLLNTQWSC
jgi:hypothetical protein